MNRFRNTVPWLWYIQDLPFCHCLIWTYNIISLLSMRQQQQHNCLILSVLFLSRSKLSGIIASKLYMLKCKIHKIYNLSVISYQNGRLWCFFVYFLYQGRKHLHTHERLIQWKLRSKGQNLRCKLVCKRRFELGTKKHERCSRFPKENERNANVFRIAWTRSAQQSA